MMTRTNLAALGATNNSAAGGQAAEPTRTTHDTKDKPRPRDGQ
jgi:hypothetical protein